MEKDAGLPFSKNSSRWVMYGAFIDNKLIGGISVNESPNLEFYKEDLDLSKKLKSLNPNAWISTLIILPEC